MLRSTIVQSFLDFYESPNYLEVGVASGATFHALKAGRKTAVDPRFKFDYKKAAETDGNSYFQVNSDTYFGEIADEKERFDVVFLDGLHTFEQTLRDLINTLSYVHQKSIIIIDDVMPVSYLSAIDTLEKHIEIRKITRDPSAQWMGDVYRLVYFIETFIQQYEYSTISDLHGVLVMWRKQRTANVLPNRSVKGIASLDYGDFLMNQSSFAKKSLADVISQCSTDLELYSKHE